MDARRAIEGRGVSKLCSVEGCGRSAVAKGLCKPHYDMLRDHGRTDYQPVRMNTTKCKADGCDAFARQKGLCDKHYQRLRSYGDPNHVPVKVKSNVGSMNGAPTINKPKKQKNPEHKPPRGPRPFQGPCSEFGCGKIATKTGRCARHSKQPAGARPMLSPTSIDHIRANRNGLTPQQLADWFRTTPSTVVAVQGGRNWGYLRG